MARPPVDANRKGLSLWMSGNSERSKPVRGDGSQRDIESILNFECGEVS